MHSSKCRVCFYVKRVKKLLMHIQKLRKHISHFSFPSQRQSTQKGNCFDAVMIPALGVKNC